MVVLGNLCGSAPGVFRNCGIGNINGINADVEQDKRKIIISEGWRHVLNCTANTWVARTTKNSV